MVDRSVSVVERRDAGGAASGMNRPSRGSPEAGLSYRAVCDQFIAASDPLRVAAAFTAFASRQQHAGWRQPGDKTNAPPQAGSMVQRSVDLPEVLARPLALLPSPQFAVQAI